ncbi:MAG: hypothetical protein KIT31_29120 [Deltaproteobacteria bacterium]|nr:hypothetical protein [Deltaproteobacteria bacterium]
MKVHLEHVRALLAARPATRVELAARRGELLGFLDEYIAKGSVPKNAHLPWRSAVFIDDDGAICAVGYLIERSAGRALSEKIAATHRYDFLEDIAAAMPEVDAWIRSSGFTLEELASIQPAYASPNVMTWRTWDLVKHAPPDGPFSMEPGWRGSAVAGAFLGKKLHGAWTVTNKAGVVIGSGELVRGNGTWRSYYADGKAKMAEGPYVDNVANGRWTLYHPSGNVAATGSFVRGMRAGAWQFYNDIAGGKLLAEGAFDGDGSVTGTWKHYDATGALLARTYKESGNRIDVVPAADGVVHQIHQWTYDGMGPSEDYVQELERLSLGGEQIYVHTTEFRKDSEDAGTIVYDVNGFKLERGDGGGWTASDCHWSKKRAGVARAGELAWLHEMLFNESAAKAVTVEKADYGPYVIRTIHGESGPKCDAPVAVPAARGAVLDKLIAPRAALRAASPTFVRELVLREEDLDGVLDEGSADSELSADAADLRRTLTAYTLRHVEWPHIDGRFDRLFVSMAGRLSWEWHSSDLEADGTSPLENAHKERCARDKSCD